MSFFKHVIPMRTRAWLRTISVISRDYGHYGTLLPGRTQDAHGEPLPWISYCAIFHLARLDLSGCRVLEFGSGGSTRYWAGRAREVVSIETDAGWFDRVRRNLPDNAKLLHFDGSDPTGCFTAVDEMGLFDVVVIDGSWRPECAARCLRWLSDRGLVILDNPDWYPTAHRNMAAHDLIEVSFSGLTPGWAYSTTTNLYFRRTFALPFKQEAPFAHVPGSLPYNHEIPEGSPGRI